jgi:hypothetical protein
MISRSLMAQREKFLGQKSYRNVQFGHIAQKLVTATGMKELLSGLRKSDIVEG